MTKSGVFSCVLHVELQKGEQKRLTLKNGSKKLLSGFNVYAECFVNGRSVA